MPGLAACWAMREMPALPTLLGRGAWARRDMWFIGSATPVRASWRELVVTGGQVRLVPGGTPWGKEG
jgi:hypothetical protein